MTSSLKSSAPALELDADQKAAVTADDPAIAVLAGPGSGKTRTLSLRTSHLLAADPGSSALLLTFTNKAAAEMKSRALAATAVGSERIRASTFHTFCAEVLRSHGDLVGVSRDFEILDQEEAEDVAQAVASARGVPNLQGAWSAFRVRRLVATGHLDKFGGCFQSEKSARGVVDFDDLVVGVGALFEARPDIAEAYAAKYRHILVDEFQDTNSVQFAVVSALAQHARTVSIFADDDQAIFGFAGAETANIVRFAAQLNARRFPLTVNYRSGKEIVALANKLIEADPTSSGRRMKWKRAGGFNRVLEFANPDVEAETVAAEIEAMVRGGRAPSEVAVLVRSGYRAERIVGALHGRDLPVSDWRGPSHQPADRRVLSTCLSVVRGALNSRQVERLSKLMGVDAIPERNTEAFLAHHAARPLAKGLREVRRLAFEGAVPHVIAEAARNAVA